ncbi:TadE/TadG family type IV pilus assembly protein [Acetivibrio clariflavus]|uniref:TadE/TadG family type IV pilus assembly protein n=1 Tax=Acetivibrio clariflavus TaxID=288965 RepID=UPI000487371E|nr:TadE/TadG family type IV pilus assembly protein [Acetivibrio clariflavus]
MKNLKAGVKSFAKEDKGAIIVEASIVFPVMFFVLFFLILFGNVIYKQCQINSIVTEYAILGAQYCADPLLAQMEANGGAVPTSVDVKPYRYIFGNMGDVEDMIEERVKKALAGELTFFRGMQPVLDKNAGKIASYNNYVLYSTFSVEVHYQIKFPIRFLGYNTPTVIKGSSRAEIPVIDPAELIRNTDMAIDFLEDTIVGQKVASVFKKVNSFINEFSKK